MNTLRQKILQLVDKIAASKYFQSATENKYVKKAMETVSKTNIVLSVEVDQCIGTMALNIPPPPSNRLWSVCSHWCDVSCEKPTPCVWFHWKCIVWILLACTVMYDDQSTTFLLENLYARMRFDNSA